MAPERIRGWRQLALAVALQADLERRRWHASVYGTYSPQPHEAVRYAKSRGIKGHMVSPR